MPTPRSSSPRHALSRLGRSLACALAVTILLSGTVEAEDIATISSRGEIGSSSKDARTRALDLAFVAAVRDVVGQLAPPSEYKRLHDDIAANVERRARLFVASFRVEKELDDGKVLRVWIAAKIDRDKVRARLGELGVKFDAAGPRPEPAVDTATVGGFLVVLDAASGEDAATVGERERVAAQFAATLTERGYPAAFERLGDGEVRGQSLDKAKKRGAAVVAILGQRRESGKGVRGTRLIGSHATVTVALLDAKSGETFSQAMATGSGVGEAAALAAGTADAEAVRNLVSELTPAIAKRFVRTTPEALRGQAVVVRGFSRYASVAAVVVALEGTPGVKAVVPQRFGPGQITMVVRGTAPASRLAASARGVTLPEGGLQVSESGGAITVTVAGEPRI